MAETLETHLVLLCDCRCDMRPSMAFNHAAAEFADDVIVISIAHIPSKTLQA